ncbi:NAD(P)/FAD-dependent oxidoreductase [Plastoroseomonas hellenica]|uniref:NAD(P)/FAD-dependent oxidoreductase n=1 Tax=Plastoroseomonas hellenica TaxID=2687306 RepID=UPI001BA6EF69|nr:FAD-dependent oxidoreductase [Plastoroseomonas hellenica]MBR0645149.1 FAD-binding oxidoreductase [Plastoroseomonas hellenica]
MATGGATEGLGWPPSLWAAVTPAGPALPALEGMVETEVAVIGAGFTGLSTAIHLREAGIPCIVVEAAEPGWGASGRNNGQVIPTLSRHDPAAIIRRHGAAGERFVAVLRDSAATLFDLARRHGIAAEAEQAGWVQPAHTPGRMRVVERRMRDWESHGAPVALLDRAALREMLGSDAWFGGFTNPTGGHVNPLALARGMAATALTLGATILARSPVTGIAHQGGRWLVRSERGTVRARALVLATNAYTGTFNRSLAPEIAMSVVPVLSWQMATRPIGDNVARSIIPGRQAMSDTHGELYFARWDARGRLVTGGAVAIPANQPARLRPMIGARLQRLWPQIGEVQFDYVWSGNIGMTTDYFPHLHRLGPDGYAWAGCNGRAVALSVALGREFARAVQGVPEAELGLPFTDPRPVPLHGLARRAASLMLMLYRWRDAREVA